MRSRDIELGGNHAQDQDTQVYGKTVQTPQDESHPINPIGHYGGSKAEAEKMIKLIELKFMQKC